MKIAVPYKDGRVDEHFGRAKEFKIYSIVDFEPVTGEVIAPEDLSHEAVARELKSRGVEVVLCGLAGEHAKEAVENEHILLFTGITGAADDVISSFLEGNLEYGADFINEGESCGGCSGSCGSCGGCGGGYERPAYVETRTFTDIVTLTEENFQSELLDDPALIMVEFWAGWCEPCKLMAPAFEQLNVEKPQVKFCRINVDEQPNLAAMFGVDTVPTFAVVQDRHTLTGMVGLHDPGELRFMLESCQ